MQNKKAIIEKFNKKLNILKKHSKLYFSEDNPEISDSDYDKLKNEILDLGKKFNYLQELIAETNLVGAPSSNNFKKIKHLSPMLSLSNAFQLKDMSDFLKKINNFLKFDNKEIELFAEPKIDGISATLIYEKGILTRGLSRGDGLVGEDILENLKTIKNIPKK